MCWARKGSKGLITCRRKSFVGLFMYASLATVDGRNPANQLSLVVYPIIYRVSYIPGGCLGFLPSTVCQKLPVHQHWQEKKLRTPFYQTISKPRVWSTLQKTRGKKNIGGTFPRVFLGRTCQVYQVLWLFIFSLLFWGAENNTIQLKLHRKMFFFNQQTHPPHPPFHHSLIWCLSNFWTVQYKSAWIFLLLQKRSATEYPRIRKLWSWPPMWFFLLPKDTTWPHQKPINATFDIRQADSGCYLP